jgi:hypothetical protein
VRAGFNAASWLAQASPKAIIDLAKGGFGGNLTSDAVAEFYENRNEAVKKMMAWVSSNQDVGQEIGFECNVYGPHVKRWLMHNRQDVGINAAPDPEIAHVAEWVGLNHKIDFNDEAPAKQDEWRSRFLVATYGEGAEFSEIDHLRAFIYRHPAHVSGDDDVSNDDGVRATAEMVRDRLSEDLQAVQPKRRFRF